MRTDSGIVAIFELEVCRDKLTAGCSCGETMVIRRSESTRSLLADWLFDHSRCPEVEVCR